MVQFFVEKELGVNTNSTLENGKHKAVQASHCVRRSLCEEDLGSFGKFLLMVFDEPLKAGRDVKNVLFLINGEDDGWNLLFVVILEQLQHYLHFFYIKSDTCNLIK